MDRMVANPPSQKTAQLTTAAADNAVVLVVSESENVAKRIESHLRNAGHPVRCAWVADIEELEDVLRRGAPDILLGAEGLPRAPLKEVVEISARLCPDLPVLLLSTRFGAEEVLAAHAAGARDLVAYEDLRDLKHLEFVLQREFASHRHLRALRTVRSRLDDFESRHKQLLAGTNDAVVHIQEGIVSHTNPAFATLLGYGQTEELLEMPLMDLVCPDQQLKVKEHMKLLNKGKAEGKPLECCLLKQDGGKVHITAQLTRGNVDGENFVEMLIRAEAAAQPAAAAGGGGEAPSGRLAFFDALTAAINGVSQQKMPRAALLIAVDDFAGLEERIGLHDAEEAVLMLDEWIHARLSPQDQAFRFSTGELAAIVHRPSATEFEQFGDMLVKEVVKQVFNTTGHEAHLTLSIAAYPLSGGEQVPTVASEIVREARKLAVRGGGKQFINLGPTAKNAQGEREEARRASQIKRAIEENRLKLAYQSIASLEGDTRQHFDVLVRMIDETGKEQHAAEFIAVAEKFGMMRTIDRWVVARALKVLAKRESSSEASSLFVKISEESLKDAEGYIAWLQEQLKQRPLKPEELVFEFQELTLQNHIRKAKVLHKALRDLGGYIAIEHFGIGSNSAQLMEHVPPQFVKFHPSFTHQFHDKEMHKKMTTLMETARQAGVKTIVSHVEDANVMARLWQMGVNYIQGFHVQEPEVVLLSADVR
ncbi:GGDEF domain-containing response regulator [Solimonas sp. K1W22B-7]|uniref:EAL domain-containing protein n=1 Tax=Solimonas sp. K1W22B-7 TaxID=2303331 RepID=UPI000E3341AC|nr:EAL domain-containing protein [Solimonas sp. K1W22B-7]AXQ29083.1 GGDEF domain-containing response regulator [Solimonas sp. K1W22B-7]